MDATNVCWRLLPFVAIVLVGIALLLPGCDKDQSAADLYRQLERQSGGGTP